jgi:hypothetical protein
MRIEHPREDVETPRVVSDLHFGLESGIAVFFGIEFAEAGYGGRTFPYWVVVAAVDYWWLFAEHSARATEPGTRGSIGLVIDNHLLSMRTPGKCEECKC